jgi:peptidoglycan/LPS O-acetylase OafA/YrhL
VAAAALLYAVLGLPVLGKWLGCRPLRFLGAISFGVYLVHAPMLYTVFVPLYLAVRTSPAGLAALLGVFLIVAAFAGYVFTRLVDRPTIAAIRRIQPPRWRLSVA